MRRANHYDPIANIVVNELGELEHGAELRLYGVEDGT